VKLCKVYSLADAHEDDPFWQDLLQQMSPGWKALGALHRKYWEWGLGLYGLHKLGCIRPDAQGLGVAAGIEWPLFYLANRVQRVVATDLYILDSNFRDPDPTIPGNAALIAPFPYRQEALVFQRMNALELQFPANTFDFVFSFSSIEHFGGHGAAALAMQQIARVLKPGGVACIATELIINDGRNYEFFRPEEIEPCFVKLSGMEMVEPLDLHVDDELIAKPVHFDFEPGYQGDTGPHTSVACGNLTFTSIEFFLRKPRNWKPITRWTRRRLYARMMADLGLQRTRESIPSVVRRSIKRLLHLS